MEHGARNLPVALVTGASGGFGMRTCIALAEQGYKVVASMRNLEKKESLMEEAEKKNVSERIECVRLDVTEEDEIASAVSSVIERFGKIDVLVNNAGFAAGGFVEDVSMEEWRKQFDTNFFGLVAVTKAVLPSMRERESGTVINISSISGRVALPALGPYSASKFAVEGFSETLRLEMKPYGVNVVLVEPGSYKTDIWSKGMEAIEVNPDSPYKKKTERLMKMVNHIAETSGDPDEVAQLIVRIVKSDNPALRYPVGRGVKSAIQLRNLLPWKWMERAIMKRM